jgi:hypothetical protein
MVNRQLPPHYTIENAAEAVIYADLHADNWQKTSGALAWLRREIAQLDS